MRGWSKRRSGTGGSAVGSSGALHETKGIPRDTDFLAEADLVSPLRSGMGEEAWEEAWRKGRAMTLEEAVEYALSEGDSSMIASRTLEQTSATHPSVRPLPPRAGGGQAGGARAHQPPDRERARALWAHRGEPRQQHPQEAEAVFAI